jgi:hypothetical protein
MKKCELCERFGERSEATTTREMFAMYSDKKFSYPVCLECSVILDYHQNISNDNDNNDTMEE